MMATRTNVIECPFCGHEIKNFNYYVGSTREDADFSIKCRNEACEKYFHVEMKVSTTFKTTRIK